MPAADAQAVIPDLRLESADPAGDRTLLDRLADGCTRYTPWTAVDLSTGEIPAAEALSGGDHLAGGGLWLDIAGAAHLFGGETAVLDDLTARLARLGFAARPGLADTAGAAWAWARFGDGERRCLDPGAHRAALADLPVAALRLPPSTIAGLTRLGLRRIGDLIRLPRAGLAARFGRLVGLRLDQALGDADEAIAPRHPPAAHHTRIAFAEPIARPEDIAAAVRHLIGELIAGLERRRLGVRQLALSTFRVDSSTTRLTVGANRPCRDARHLFGLIADPLSRLDAGFGIDLMRLDAPDVAPLAAAQGDLAAIAPTGTATRAGDQAGGLDYLLDILGNRLGFDRVFGYAPRASHLPERMVERQRPGAPSSTPIAPPLAWPPLPRPLRLLTRPEAIEVMAPLPDAPPLLFRWRRRTHRVAGAEGPERLSAEWWRENAADRDYYRVEDQEGRRFWVYRQGSYGGGDTVRWFLHGIFP